MLEPKDLSAAADPAIRLTDERERDLLAGTSAALAQSCLPPRRPSEREA